MFNFGISKESAIKTVRPQLKPWNIYDVKFLGCEVREFAGKKDPSVVYKVLDIKFENEEGYFTVTKFFPKAGDDKRKEVDAKNGGKRELPSNFEELMNVVKQTAEVLTPEGFKKMSELSAKFKSFDDVANNRVVAEIPSITGVFDGTATITDNYIGNKLFFTPYQEQKREEYLKSKPSDPEKTEKKTETKKDPLMEVEEPVTSTQDDEELDLASLMD